MAKVSTIPLLFNSWLTLKKKQTNASISASVSEEKAVLFFWLTYKQKGTKKKVQKVI
jgi:hypothetical protein